jgi:hypothetical protein
MVGLFCLTLGEIFFIQVPPWAASRPQPVEVRQDRAISGAKVETGTQAR